MKRIFTLFVVIAVFTAQIVKASDVKDATLRKKGTQTEASTIDWLRSEKPDVSIIHMSIKQFNIGFKACLVEFNNKYKTFPEINSDVINDEIIPGLYTKELIPGKLYTFSYWNATTQTWHRWQRMAKPGETGLFYKGWDDDPIMSVYCWNFGYPTTEKVVVPKVEKPETEVVILPGTNKYFYKTDTIRERNDVFKEVQNNFFLNTSNNNFAKTANQSFTVDMSQPAGCNHQVQQCNHQQQVSTCNHQQQVSHCNHQQQIHEQPSCGCRGNRTCKKHRDKKPFFERVEGRILTYAFFTGLGWALNEIFDKDDPRVVSGQVFTQGPLTPVTTTGPGIITQGPFN